MKIFLRCITLFLLSLNQLISFAQAPLIPLPQELKWGGGSLDLSKGLKMNAVDESFIAEAAGIESYFQSENISISSVGDQIKLPFLEIIRSSAAGKHNNDESYELIVDKKGIRIKAQAPQGAFYALQTIKQLVTNAQQIQHCHILDSPAFPWRAFLVDVGRNYQPISMLKQQIDVMVQYKLNVFHFHFTEDIAWRLASKKHPGLTSGENMTRWVGDFYTEEDFRELIDYCQQRHILFLPEIDMPGHSAAFERYFKVSMQSEAGIGFIKELLTEFAETYPSLKHLHIGGDEVKITNKNFMPTISKFVEDMGFKTYGWDPGSNLIASTVRQLWMGGPKAIPEEGELVFIDSKHLYINHMDPLETVTTLFFRKIAEQDAAHANMLGATLCSWPDRAVAKPIDMFYQSAIYPSLLTFSERIWKGGGEAGWKANLPEHNSKNFQDFVEFENRLLKHKDRYFTNLPFPYSKQTAIKWELVGPFDNNGELNASFPIEKDAYTKTIPAQHKVVGGTVVLRHWWADIIPGAIPQPQENTTYYARTKIWADKAGEKDFWIGFNNLSRSYASDSPVDGTWDDRQSKVWVNQQLIPPHQWKQAGKKGALEVPLLDEGYSYREPTKISLLKGWNEVLVKLPVGSFKGKDWQNPVKWMFTFVPYQ